MKTRIVRIGNSQGIRIPKPLLEQTGLQDEVEIKPENGSLVIRPLHQPRTGWTVAFQKMSSAGDDTLLDEETTIASTWDRDQWEWQ
jgi:antitoxin MazE